MFPRTLAEGLPWGGSGTIPESPAGFSLHRLEAGDPPPSVFPPFATCAILRHWASFLNLHSLAYTKEVMTCASEEYSKIK